MGQCRCGSAGHILPQATRAKSGGLCGRGVRGKIKFRCQLEHEASVDDARWRLVWCRHCGRWHRHGAAEGHREAH